MKKLKVLSALLAAALVVAMLNPASFLLEARAADEGGSSSNSGLVINKTATANPDGGFDITLEAYATGSKVISSVNKDVPTDIVLVLDQSGSMKYCITCGKSIGLGSHTSHTKTSYEEVTSVNNSSWNTYYIKDGDTYTQVQYCNGTHGYPWSQTNCQGGAGWYTSTGSADHTLQNKFTPKTTDNPDGRQFYTQETTSVPATSRLSALTTAVNTFINNVSAKAKGSDGTADTDDDVDHRIAVVGFASTGNSYTNTELLSTQNVVNYSEATNNNYEDALVSVNGTDGNVNTRLTTAVSRLTADGDTYLEYGMDMANKIFAQNPVDSNERQRVVVVFTDGYPAPNGTNDFNYSMADTAIGYAKESKSTYNATVYTVGVFGTADPTADITSNFATSDGWSGNSNNLDDSQEATAANRYMHYVSSNYPEAESLNKGGSLNSNADPFHNGDSYYLSASDADTLNNIFQQISDQIENTTSSTTLNENAVIKDIIAPQFQLPDGATASNITLETYTCTGVDDSGNYTFSSQKNTTSLGETATVEGTEVSVTGFDFANNWCGTETDNGTTTAHGNKLVIKFNVKTKEGFLGGNDVYTNESAGVYENATATNPVMTFPKPTVNVPIGDVTVTATDKNVYLLGNLTADQIKSGANVTCGVVNLDLSKANENYGLETWQTEYVDITVTYYDGKDNEISELKDLKEDTTYTVSVSVAPKKTTSSQGTPETTKTGTGEGKINVFKPQLTFKDSDVYYGDTAPSNYDGNKTGEVWKHDNTLSTDSGVTMIGDAPTLNLTYTPDTNGVKDGKIAVKTDIPVDVTVKIGTTDVTDETSFVHTDCTGKTCGKPVNGAFWLHVKTCTLTIEKKAATGTSIGNDEYFVFTVKKDNADYTQVTIKGTTSVTIKELPVGTYTIEEDTSVAWRYGDPTYSANAVLSSNNTNGTLTCTNTKTTDNWLNHFTRVINTYGKTEGTKD